MPNISVQLARAEIALIRHDLEQFTGSIEQLDKPALEHGLVVLGEIREQLDALASLLRVAATR